MSQAPVLVRTAIGEQRLADGMIYVHEHLWLDLATPDDQQGRLDRLDLITQELCDLKALGVAAVMELTCRGMGRNVARLAELQRASGVQIIPSTGYYHHGFHPPQIAMSSVDQIAADLRLDLEGGMDGTDVRPMILGEIGGSGAPLHKDERKVFQAVGELAHEYPVVVSTHAHLGTGGLEQVLLLLGKGVAPERIVIGHLDLCPAIDEVLDILSYGVYVAFDTVGKARYAADARRIAYIQALLAAGFGHRLLLSCDISRNTYLRALGGQGYAHLLRVFVPALQASGVSAEAVQQMLVESPRRLLTSV